MSSIHSARLERWLGAERIENLSHQFANWYGPPVQLLDVPGGVRVTKGGDFEGRFQRGHSTNALDQLQELHRRLARAGRRQRGVLHTGFTSISDALSEAAGGKRQMLGTGPIVRVGVTGVVGAANTLWNSGSQPAAGAIGSAAPGGRACTSATTGAFQYTNPGGSDTMHLTGADFSASVVNMSLLLYDRLFDVAKTMNSTATEAVTGVPTRYQGTTPGAADYAGGNFLFVEAITALAATAHNWTTCTYTDQDGNTGATLPSLTGNSGNIAQRLDHPTSAPWFAPLASGDTGVKALTQMQCSAAVATGTVDFVIGHPLGVLAFPLANYAFPFDWLTSRDQAPRIFDSACLAFLELNKPATSATTYTGMLYGTAG